MSYVEIHPETRQWLTPDHQAVLAAIARWLDEEEPCRGGNHAESDKGARS